MDVVETLSLKLPDLAATRRLGAALAAVARVGDVIALRGDLGAGKTELARATIRAAAGDPDLIVPSPTFALLETYDTPRGAFWHFDLYRLDAPGQVYELGWEDALADAGRSSTEPEVQQTAHLVVNADGGGEGGPE